MGFTKV